MISTTINAKKFIPFFLTVCFASTIYGCESTAPEVKPPPVKTTPTQYGSPFDGVPEVEDVAMYEVNPRVFSSSQNLTGITSRLDSIKGLGTNVVWLMPIYQTGTDRSVGSPYAIKDYLKIHPDYGTIDDLRALVEKAHGLGMAVMLDWVANHTAWDHAWMRNSGWYETDANGNVIIPPGTNWQDVAELNYDNANMRMEMIEAMKYWILEANVDGYRCDYAEGVPLDFWQAAIDTLRNIPDREILLFAEASDKKLLSTGFDMTFGWAFYGKLWEVYNNGSSAGEIYLAHKSEYNGLAAGKHIVRWTSNHDENAWENTPLETFQGEDGAFGAFVLAATMGGVSLIYNGQEVGETQKLPFFEGNFTSIAWNLNPVYAATYKRLMIFRAQSEAIRGGILQNYTNPDVSAFVREGANEEVLVLVNVRDSQSEFVVPDEFINTTWTNVLEDQQSIELMDKVVLQPFQALVLRK